MSDHVHEDVTFLCTTCESFCKTSRLLNDREHCENVALTQKQLIKKEALDTIKHQFLQASFSDCHHDGQELTYLFEDEIPHLDSGSALEISAKRGCHLCTLFWHRLIGKRYSWYEENGDLINKELVEASRHSARRRALASSQPLFVRVGVQLEFMNPVRLELAIVLYVGRHGDKLPDLRSTLYACDTALASAQSEVPFRKVHEEHCASIFTTCTASDATLQLAKRWINACKFNNESGQDHSSCSNSRAELDMMPKSPVRLLDVRPTKPCLYNASFGTEENLQYLCLSHCWGGADIFKLNRTTETVLRNGVDIEKLPLTFRDAIDITRRLGYSFIWIDSLCIFQDDLDDWETEAAKMAFIYSHADVTIAALGSKDSHGGCYSSRNPLSYWPCILPTKRDLTAFAGRVRPFHNENFATALLPGRGWVFQERILSPRVLFFGKFGIKWECSYLYAEDGFPRGFFDERTHINTIPSAHLGSGEILMKTFNGHLYLEGINDIGLAVHHKFTDITPFPIKISVKFLRYWYDTVQEYTNTQLTFDSDKLIAISGVIELIQRRTGLTSFAGLWRELLLDDMLWTTEDPNAVLEAKEYQAPSFCWASVNGSIVRKLNEHGCSSNCRSTGDGWEPHLHNQYQGSRLRRYLATVVNYEIAMADPRRTTGRVVSGSIQLKCFFSTFRCVYTSYLMVNGETEYFFTHPYINVTPDNESYALSKLKPWFSLDSIKYWNSQGLRITCVPLVEWYGDANQAFDNNKSQPQSGRNVPVSWTERRDEYEGFSYNNAYRHIAGLILVPSTGETYRRIGVFEDCWRSGEERWTEQESAIITIV